MPRGLRVCRICRDEKKLPVEQAYVAESRRDHLSEKHPDITWTNWNDEKGRYFRAATRQEKFSIDKIEGAEEQLYQPVKSEFERLFQYRFGNCRLETTFKGDFSENLKGKIKQDIVHWFIKRMKGSEHRSPDITGFVIDPKIGAEDLITVEVKNEAVSLGDVYQAKMYAELFNTKYSFLISTEPIPDELKRLHRVHFILNRFIDGTRLCLVEFDAKTEKIVHDSWFAEAPFKYDLRDLAWGEPGIEDLQLRGASLLGDEAARLYVENVGLKGVTANRFSIDLAEPKSLVHSKLIGIGDSGALAITPNVGTKFEKGKSYEVRVWTDRGTLFLFPVTF